MLIYFEALAAGEKVAAACLMDQMDPGQLVDVIHVVDRWLVAMGVRVAE